MIHGLHNVSPASPSRSSEEGSSPTTSFSLVSVVTDDTDEYKRLIIEPLLVEDIRLSAPGIKTSRFCAYDDARDNDDDNLAP